MFFPRHTISRSSPSPRKAGLSASRGQIEPSSFDQLPSTHPPSLPSLTSTILPHSVSPAPHGGSPSSLLTFGLPSTSAAAVARVGSLTKPAALDISDTSGQFLAETRATFARLEKEAEELEKTYQSFHQKAERNESPRLREDEPLLPFHQATLVDHGSSSSDTTPDREISPTFPTSAMSLQPQGVATLLSQSPPVPVSSSLSSTTTTASSTAQTVVTSSSSAQQNFTQSLVSASHPPSSLTTVVAVAPPALSATTTPPLEVAAVSPPPPLTSGTEAKPTQTVAQQGLSTEETATKARQRLTLDDWWKKSPPLPPSSTSSKQPSNTTAVASSSSVDSSKAAAVDEGHSKSLHITEKPKIKLDDLWKNSNTVSEAHTVGGGSNTIATNSNVQNGRLSHSPPPVSIEKPKLSLDDLWRHPSPSKPPATATSAAKPTVTPSKQLKEEREEKEKLRREQQLQEQERVRKELEELERQEKLKKIEPLNHQGTVELLEHKNDSDKQQRTNSIVGQEASVEVTNKETEGGEVKKEPVGSDDNGIDPVMLKYMELVKEKREKQQVRP